MNIKMDLKLKNTADIKSLIYIFITTSILILQLVWIGINPFICTQYLFMSVAE